MKIMIDRAIKFRCRAADAGAHSGLDCRPSVVGCRSSPESAGAGAAVYHATGCHSATIAGNEPVRGLPRSLLRPLLAYEIAASRRCRWRDDDGNRRRQISFVPGDVHDWFRGITNHFLESVRIQTALVGYLYGAYQITLSYSNLLHS